MRLSEKLNLSNEEIETIVLEWYMNDTESLLQDSDGLDLEEVLSVFEYDFTNYDVKTKKFTTKIK